MPNKVICCLILPLILASAELRNHRKPLHELQNDQGQCKIIEKTTTSFNNNCAFRYSACAESPNEIKTVIDCTFCEGQKNCPYLKYLAEPECI